MSKQKEKIDYGLKFFVEVLGAENLHWGFFPEKRFPKGELSLNSFKEAQREYTNHLLSYIPPSIHRILDVGSGTGATSDLLYKRGYNVTCISNDEFQKEIITKRYPHLRFIKSRFEDFIDSRLYDLLLFSESAQYLDMNIAPRKAYDLLNPSGYILLCDYFRKEDNLYYKTCKVLDDFKKKMKEGSFVLAKEEDITDYVIPTIDFASFYYNRYGLPAITIAGEYIQSQFNRPLRLLTRILFGRKLKKLNYYLTEHTPKKFDSKLFREKVIYLTQLWEKK